MLAHLSAVVNYIRIVLEITAKGLIYIQKFYKTLKLLKKKIEFHEKRLLITF